MLKEFKTFAMRGNVMDMAVGIILGAAFGSIVTSLVNDVLMPPIGVLLGKVDFTSLFITLKHGVPAGPYLSLVDAKAAHAVTMNYGIFINSIISFLIVSFSVFILIKNINRLQKPAPAAAPTTKDCPFCFSAIPLKAVRCPQCTSEVK